MNEWSRRQCGYALAGLAILAALPYLRSLWLPMLSDDHLQVILGRRWGPISGWSSLMSDALFRSRATSILVTHWTEMAVGVSPFAFHVSSVALHIVNVWLVLLLGSWRAIGWRKAALAAAFFAVHEGHQEAVIWYAAMPELLVFAFGIASFLCWVQWLQSDGTKWKWLAASVAAFVLALYSKESAVLVVPLMALPVVFGERDWGRRIWRKAALALLPFAAVAGLYFLGIQAAASGHLHYHDGTFSLTAPFPRTILYSTWRLFWFWGLLGAAALVATRREGGLRTLTLALAWAAIGFLPYSFLTYMPFTPSRHTYFAGVGAALVVASGFLAIVGRYRPPRWAVAAVVALVVFHNSAYVWIRKHRQYEERAAPVVAVAAAARQGVPVYVHCFPFPMSAADAASIVDAGNPEGMVREWREGPDSGPPPNRIYCLNPHAPGPHPANAIRLAEALRAANWKR